MSSALWWVANGRAVAPPGIGCMTGVSTSRNPRASRNARTVWMRRVRSRNTSRTPGIDEEVDVALAVAGLDVLEPVPLLRQRPQRLRQERPGLDLDGELARARAHEVAGHADEVRHVQVGEPRVGSPRTSARA